MGRWRRNAVPLVILVTLLALAACTGRALPVKLGAPGASRAPGAISGRPNIVFVLTDDLSWNLVRYMPHVQALRAEGTTFRRYYVVDSLCCPSRAAILTGEYPHDDRVLTNTGPDGGFKAFQKNADARMSFGPALQKAGYRTAMMGKYLNGYQPSDGVAPGWNEWDVAGDGYPEFNYKLNQNGKTKFFGHQPRDYLTDVLSGRARAFINASASAHAPFALEVASFAPHYPVIPAPRDVGTFLGLTAPRTPAFDKLPAHAPPWLRNFPPLPARQKYVIDREFVKRVEAVQAVDMMIGRIEATLHKDGIARNTYFVFSSDNGYHMGEYRMRPGKQTAFDTDIHVPLVVSGPHVPPGRNVDAMASSIDLAPTFEAIARARPPATRDGVSMLNLWHGAPAASDWQQAILVEHHGPDLTVSDPDYQPFLHGDPPSYEAVRTADALYVHYDSGGQEYYDTARDPYELHNIATTVPLARLHRMRATLRALVGCHGAAQCTAAARVNPASASG